MLLFVELFELALIHSTAGRRRWRSDRRLAQAPRERTVPNRTESSSAGGAPTQRQRNRPSERQEGMSDPPDPPPSKQNLLTPLLEQVFPTPVSFFSQSATASINDVVPLCLHCLMIEAGCTPLSSKKNRPPAKWNAHEDEWIVEYRHEKDGATATFRLHCSLQRRSGRLFVHAEEIEEASGEKNIQVLGLQMTNYTKVVPEDTKGGAWGDYVKNERTLKEMFRQFIVKPLLAVSGRKALEGLREEVGAYQEVDGGAEGDVTNAEKAAAEGAGAACAASSSTKPAAEGRGEGEGVWACATRWGCVAGFQTHHRPESRSEAPGRRYRRSSETRSASERVRACERVADGVYTHLSRHLAE